MKKKGSLKRNYYELLGFEKVNKKDKESFIIYEKDIEKGYHETKNKWSEFSSDLSFSFLEVLSLIEEAFYVLSHPKLKKNYDDFFREDKEEIFVEFIGSQFSSFFLEIEKRKEKEADSFAPFFSDNCRFLQGNLQKKVVGTLTNFILLDRHLKEKEMGEKFISLFEKESIIFLKDIKITMAFFFSYDPWSGQKEETSLSWIFSQNPSLCKEEIKEVIFHHVYIISLFKVLEKKKLLENSTVEEGKLVGLFTDLRIFMIKITRKPKIALDIFFKNISKNAIDFPKDIKNFILLAKRVKEDYEENSSSFKEVFYKEVCLGDIKKLSYDDFEDCLKMCKRLYNQKEEIIHENHPFSFYHKNIFGVSLILFIVFCFLICVWIWKSKKKSALLNKFKGMFL